MMKKLLKNYNYLAMICGTIFALITLITLFFVKSTTYFTIAFILNLLVNFSVVGLIMFLKSNDSNSLRFKNMGLYLLTTLFFLLMDVVIINNVWDLNVYTNLMYVSNIKLYLTIYSLFVLAMVMMSIYVIIKGILENNKSSVRQNSAKH